MSFNIASAGNDWLTTVTSKPNKKRKARYLKPFEIVKDFPIVLEGRDIARVARQEWNAVVRGDDDVRFFTNVGTRQNPHHLSLPQFIMGESAPNGARQKKAGNVFTRRNIMVFKPKLATDKPRVWLSDEEYRAQKIKQQIERLQRQLTGVKA